MASLRNILKSKKSDGSKPAPPPGYKELVFDCLCGDPSHKIFVQCIPEHDEKKNIIGYRFGIELQVVNTGYLSMALNGDQAQKLVDELSQLLNGQNSHP